MVKTWLNNKGISYDERNVDDPANAREAFQQSGFTMVPVTVVGDQVIAGMNISLISKALML